MTASRTSPSAGEPTDTPAPGLPPAGMPPELAMEIAIDRLASGEMERAEEDAFLAGCEIEPDQWRQVVLGFIERRRLGTLLQAADPAGRPIVCSVVTRPRPAAWLRRLPGVATAAAVLVATGLGGYAAGMRARPQAVPEPAIAWNDMRAIEALSTELVSADVRAELLASGIEVEERPVVRWGADEDGNGWIIPEREIHLRLVNRE